VQVPITFGAVVIAFADPQLDGLVLDAEVISGIFRRTITRYQDPRIAALNPGRDLPDQEIIPVHRSDGSGTTSVFTTWLADEDEQWAGELGAGIEVSWPAGTIGGPGNEGVAANLSQSPGGLDHIIARELRIGHFRRD
jgi:phosphate transport system substrate-binding protein